MKTRVSDGNLYPEMNDLVKACKGADGSRMMVKLLGRWPAG